MRQFIKAKAQFGNTTFYRIKTGQITSKGGATDHLSGILTRVNILQDEGNPEFKVKPHEVIEFTLEQAFKSLTANFGNVDNSQAMLKKLRSIRHSS